MDGCRAGALAPGGGPGRPTSSETYDIRPLKTRYRGAPQKVTVIDTEYTLPRQSP